jgi:hypothetical protein
MIALVQDNILRKLPNSVMLDTMQIMYLYSPSTLSSNAGNVSLVSEQLYKLDLSNIVNDTTLVLSNDVESKSVYLYVDVPNLDQFKHWLNVNQFGFLSDIIDGMGADKFKEAAIAVNNISRMIGTEYALSEMMRVLELTNNVELARSWKKDGDIAYDIMTSTAYAKLGYALTNELFLTYYKDDLNPWTDTIENSSGEISIDLIDVMTVLTKVLPARLQITKTQETRLGLAMLSAIVTTSKYDLSYANVDVTGAVYFPEFVYYRTAPFKLDHATKLITRIADIDEIQAEDLTLVPLTLRSTSDIKQFKLFYNDVLIARSETMLTEQTFGVYLPIGNVTVTAKYLSKSDALITIEHTINVRKAVTSFDLYEPSYDGVELNYEGIDIRSIVRTITERGYAMSHSFAVPRGYLVAYIPANASNLYVSYDGVTTMYQVSIAMQVPGFTTSFERLNVLDTDELVDYIILMSKQFCGIYDYDMYTDTGHVNI